MWVGTRMTQSTFDRILILSSRPRDNFRHNVLAAMIALPTAAFGLRGRSSVVDHRAGVLAPTLRTNNFIAAVAPMRVIRTA